MSGLLAFGGTETCGGGGVDEADGDGDGGETGTGPEPGSGAAGDERAVTGATEDAVAAGACTSDSAELVFVSLACWTGDVVLVGGLPVICCNCLKASLRLSPSSVFTFNMSIACLGFNPYFSLIMRI